MTDSIAQDLAARPHVLVVDDTPDNLAIMSSLLKGLYRVTVANNGERALKFARTSPRPDLILLDVVMPGQTGYDVILELKSDPATLHIPVIFLTSMDDETNEQTGLDLGAVDYITKTMAPAIVLARIRKELEAKAMADLLRQQNAYLKSEVVRRTQEMLTHPARPTEKAAPSPGVGKQAVRFGGFALDLEQRKLRTVDGEDVELTAAEFDLLALFVRHANRPLTRDQIMEHAHNKGWEVFDRSIDLRVMRLRRKLEVNPNSPQLIKTVRNVGYVFQT